MTKKHGFTLAEVLITLGIIGVVAAMTIPTLIANTNGAKYRSQFKKTLSTLNQAALMSVAQYEFDFAGVTDECTSTVAGKTSGAAANPADGTMSFCSLFNGTLSGATYTANLSTLTRSAGASSTAGYMITPETAGVIGTTAGTAEAPSTYSGYSLADGSIVAFKSDIKSCTLTPGNTLADAVTGTGQLVNCIGFIDVNGTTLPNKEVNCSGTTATALIGGTSCTVENNAANMTDIFPVVYHDATVEPVTNAAQYVLTTSK